MGQDKTGLGRLYRLGTETGDWELKRRDGTRRDMQFKTRLGRLYGLGTEVGDLDRTMLTRVHVQARARISAIRLPPRTPSLMPLDYSIWHTISKRVITEAPDGKETKAEFIGRLRNVAKTLKKGYVKRMITRMKANIEALKDAKGWTPKND